MATAVKSTGRVEKSKVITPEFRLSYAHIWKPQTNNEGKEIWSITMIFEPNADLREMIDLAKRTAAAKWPNAKGTLRMPFRKGVEGPTGVGYDLDKNPEYEGKIICSARSYGRKVVPVDLNREPILEQSEFYSGCYCIASVTAFAYDKNGNKGVNFGLANVMKVRDGEPLANIHKADEDFRGLDTSQYENEANADLFNGEDSLAGL